MNEYFKDPVWLLAAGGAVGLALCGILVGLSELVPALGLMFSLAATGAAAGFTLSPAIGTVASYGAAATGAVLSIQLFVRITREAKKKPMVWGTSIISLLSGLLVQICEPFWNGSKITWIMFSVIAALLVIIGSVFYAQNKMEFKIIGALTSLLTPGMVLAATASSQPERISKFLLDSSAGLWPPLALLVVAAIVLGALAHVSADR